MGVTQGGSSGVLKDEESCLGRWKALCSGRGGRKHDVPLGFTGVSRLQSVEGDIEVECRWDEVIQ